MERRTTSAPLEQFGDEPSTLVGHITHWQLCSVQSSLMRRDCNSKNNGAFLFDESNGVLCGQI